mmetsp:Transcript_9413/g.28392  ORF Transcript_9413/g.28392 Transcript_9413/m.28392 type:complete len:260 (+) Transcript_9413:1792-2571(+)
MGTTDLTIKELDLGELHSGKGLLDIRKICLLLLSSRGAKRTVVVLGLDLIDKYIVHRYGLLAKLVDQSHTLGDGHHVGDCRHNKLSLSIIFEQVSDNLHGLFHLINFFRVQPITAIAAKHVLHLVHHVAKLRLHGNDLSEEGVHKVRQGQQTQSVSRWSSIEHNPVEPLIGRISLNKLNDFDQRDCLVEPRRQGLEETAQVVQAHVSHHSGHHCPFLLIGEQANLGLDVLRVDLLSVQILDAEHGRGHSAAQISCKRIG